MMPGGAVPIAWGHHSAPARCPRGCRTRAQCSGLKAAPQVARRVPTLDPVQGLCCRFPSHLTGGRIEVQREERARLMSRLLVSIRADGGDEKEAEGGGRQHPSRGCSAASGPAPVKR